MRRSVAQRIGKALAVVTVAVFAGGFGVTAGASEPGAPRGVLLSSFDRLLSTGSELWLRDMSIFEQHPKTSTAIVVAIVLQSVLITFLLLHRRQRRRVEAALRVSEERYRQVVESQTETVCRYLPDCTLTFVNEAYCRYFGLRAEELLGKSFLQLIPEESHPIVLETMRKILEEKRPHSSEHEIIRPDGTVGWMRWDDYPIFNKSSEVQEFQGIGRDVTEQHQAQAELRTSEGKFAAAFHGSPNAICINRVKDDRIVDVNECWENLFQIRRSDALNRTHTELGLCISEEDHARIHAAAEGRLTVRNHEMKMARADGTACWVSASSEPIQVGGEPCYLGIIQDITERKQAEEARQNLAHASRLALIGELTASIAHEINQPLGAILSNAEAAEMMLNQPTPPLEQLRAILSDIRKDDLRASQVIKGVRALVSKREHETAPLDLPVLVTGVLALIRPDAERRGVKLVSEIAVPAARIYGDRVQLEQVLLNLFLNGMEAMTETPAEKRRLTVRTSNNRGRHVEISVADGGHGIPPDRMPRIFDSFFTTKAQGMGLGLALVRSIVELHGGRIAAENNPDGGATFRFQLPTDKISTPEP
jgi:PAS domain S-box-containing protein